VVPLAALPNMLRGTFEMSFRWLGATMFGWTVERAARAACLTRPCFDQRPPSAAALSRGRTFPRPFLFEPPTDGPDSIAPARCSRFV